MKKFYVFFLVLYSWSMSAQPPVGNIAVDEPSNVINRLIEADYSSLNQLFDAFRNNQNVEADRVPALFRERFEGSPFLQNDWERASVVLNNGTKVEYDLLYNVFKNEFWIKKENEIRLLNITENVDYIDLNGKKFVKMAYHEEGTEKEGLLEQLAEGKMNLYKLYTCFFLKKEGEATGYESKKKDKFLIESQFFYEDTEGNLQSIPLKKDAFFKMFGDKASSMEEYAKTHKLKYKKEEDLLKLFRYYNTLFI